MRTMHTHTHTHNQGERSRCERLNDSSTSTILQEQPYEIDKCNWYKVCVCMCVCVCVARLRVCVVCARAIERRRGQWLTAGAAV
jgi:hypothetical protein